jgi:hypothetical protein
MPLFSTTFHTFCLSNVGTLALERWRWSWTLELESVGGCPAVHCVPISKPEQIARLEDENLGSIRQIAPILGQQWYLMG